MAKNNPFKTWRKANDLTQAQGAEKIGVSQASYCRFENGIEKPGPLTAKKIEQVIGIPKETLRPDIYGRA